MNPKFNKEILMENSEHQLIILKRVTITRGLRHKSRSPTYDLCITDKRLVIFNQQSPYWMRIIRNIFYKKREESDPLRSLTIEELLKKDKKSFAVNYDDLYWMGLATSLFGSSLNFKGEKIWKLIQIDKEQYDLLFQILPRIQALQGKLEIIK